MNFIHVAVTVFRSLWRGDAALVLDHGVYVEIVCFKGEVNPYV